MSQRDQNWIVCLYPSGFLQHPRGERTHLAEDAYGYHYKKDALEEAKEYLNATVSRRKDNYT